MKKFKFTVGNRILSGFLLLIIIFIINAIIVIVTLNSADKTIKKSSEIVNPSVEGLMDMILLVTRSKMLITNWVYLQNNTDDKEALKALQTIEYPDQKDELTLLMEKWEDQKQEAQMDSIFAEFEALLEIEQNIMNDLVTFDDYEDPIKQFMSQETIESEVLPRTTSIIDRLNKITAIKKREAEQADKLIIESSKRLINVTLLLGLIIVSIGIFSAVLVSKSITVPINSINKLIKKLSTGELPEEKVKTTTNDEIREMAEAMDNLIDGLKDTSLFAEKIGNGKYDSEFKPLSENDLLGNSLIEMRNNLKRVAEEDRKRNWITTGIAQFGEILRKHIDNIDYLTSEIISNLVKYMNANQGGLFIVSDEESEGEPFMTLSAAYAWDKKKYIDQKVFKGEGLAGQAWLEQDTIYITEVPDNYVKITSGLGTANPTSILIVPLKLNDEVFGVIELASFNEIEKHEIDFVEKIAESIASSISTVKVNARTQLLLEESQQMTEQMRAQEEEMRQNMEELQATQEEMERSQTETAERERIIVSTLLTFDLTDDFNILSVNDVTKRKTGFESHDLEGRKFEDLLTDKESFISAKTSLSKGDPWDGYVKLRTRNGEELALHISAGKAHDQHNNINKYLLFGSDISHATLEV